MYKAVECLLHRADVSVPIRRRALLQEGRAWAKTVSGGMRTDLVCQCQPQGLVPLQAGLSHCQEDTELSTRDLTGVVPGSSDAEGFI